MAGLLSEMPLRLLVTSISTYISHSTTETDFLLSFTALSSRLSNHLLSWETVKSSGSRRDNAAISFFSAAYTIPLICRVNGIKEVRFSCPTGLCLFPDGRFSQGEREFSYPVGCDFPWIFSNKVNRYHCKA